jgi:release factor glutamine methyltransferase
MTTAAGLKELISQLAALEYRFTTVTPETHALLNRRPGNERARTLRDVFGWNRSFCPEILPISLFDAMRAADACRSESDGLWRATWRVASLGHQLFVHSAFPTLAADAVFFGPDSYRFARALRSLGATARRAVDVGCGSGVGGIVLSHFAGLAAPVVLADINERALAVARVNAEAAGVVAEVVKSDVLREVDGAVDLIIANPPYLADEAGRAYRDGGAATGAALPARMVKEALERLDRDGGGALLMYTGVALQAELDPFWTLIADDLERSGAQYRYEEVDPDIFASELDRPAYAETERIAAVLLHATLGPRSR